MADTHYSVDPAVIGSQNIEVANSPQVKAINQALVVTPQVYAYDQYNAQQQEFNKKQNLANLDTKLNPILETIRRYENESTENKNITQKRIEENKALIDEMKAYIAAEVKAQGQVKAGAYRITTMGYNDYLKDVEQAKSQFNTIKSELISARDSNVSPEEIESIVNKVQESEKKLDKLYKIDPFNSPEYPLKTTKTIYIEGDMNIGRQPDLSPSQQMQQYAMRGEAPPASLVAAAGRQVSSGGGGVVSGGTAAPAITQSAIDSAVKKYTANPYDESLSVQEKTIGRIYQQISDPTVKYSQAGLAEFSKALQAVGIPASAAAAIVSLAPSGGSSNYQSLLAQAAKQAGSIVTTGGASLITPAPKATVAAPMEVSLNDYMAKKPFISTLAPKATPSLQISGDIGGATYTNKIMEINPSDYVPLPSGAKQGETLKTGLFSEEFFKSETPAQLKAGSLDQSTWTQVEQLGGGTSKEAYASLKAIPANIKDAYEFKYDNNSRTGYAFVDKSGNFQIIVDSGIWKSSGSETSWNELLGKGINPLATGLNEKGQTVYGTKADVAAYLQQYGQKIDVHDPVVINRFYQNMQEKQNTINQLNVAKAQDMDLIQKHRYERSSMIPVGTLSDSMWQDIQSKQKATVTGTVIGGTVDIVNKSLGVTPSSAYDVKLNMINPVADLVFSTPYATKFIGMTETLTGEPLTASQRSALIAEASALPIEDKLVADKFINYYENQSAALKQFETDIDKYDYSNASRTTLLNDIQTLSLYNPEGAQAALTLLRDLDIQPVLEQNNKNIIDLAKNQAYMPITMELSKDSSGKLKLTPTIGENTRLLNAAIDEQKALINKVKNPEFKTIYQTQIDNAEKLGVITNEIELANPKHELKYNSLVESLNIPPEEKTILKTDFQNAVDAKSVVAQYVKLMGSDKRDIKPEDIKKFEDAVVTNPLFANPSLEKDAVTMVSDIKNKVTPTREELALWGVPSSLLTMASDQQKVILEQRNKFYTEAAKFDDSAYPHVKIFDHEVLSGQNVLNAGSAMLTTVVSTVPFLMSVPYGATWAVLNPTKVPGKALEMTEGMVTDIVQQEALHPGSGVGNIIGLYISGKAIGKVTSKFPVKYGEFELPIETPEGFSKTRTVTSEAPRILESVTVDNIETFTRDASVPRTFTPTIREVPIQYVAKYKGLYLNTNINIPILRGGGTSYYGGARALVGVGTETGGKLFGEIRSGGIIGPGVNTILELPVISKAVKYVESRPNVPTGLWIGKGSPRAFGESVKQSVSGRIDFLGHDIPPAVALQKLQAVESILPVEDIAFVKSIIEARELTTKYPSLITVKEEFGEVTPISMKPETYEALQEYMNANAGDMRAYGSLVGRSYTGYGGRFSLGDIDLLLNPKKAQLHAKNMWRIYLEKEFGEGNYKIETTKKVYSTKQGLFKTPKTTDTTEVATNPKTGEVLSRLETRPSQLTGTRLTGTTPSGQHALDLHPSAGLKKYKEVLPGTKVKTIPISDLLWGKQTIGEPPVGTVVVSRAGKSEVIVEAGGRGKDAFDTFALTRTAAADAYKNPKVPLEVAMRLERSSNVLKENLISSAKKDPKIDQFMEEFKDPLATEEAINAKVNKVNKVSANKREFARTVKIVSTHADYGSINVLKAEINSAKAKSTTVENVLSTGRIKSIPQNKIKNIPVIKPENIQPKQYTNKPAKVSEITPEKYNDMYSSQFNIRPSPSSKSNYIAYASLIKTKNYSYGSSYALPSKISPSGYSIQSKINSKYGSSNYKYSTSTTSYTPKYTPKYAPSTPSYNLPPYKPSTPTYTSKYKISTPTYTSGYTPKYAPSTPTYAPKYTPKLGIPGIKIPPTPLLLKYRPEGPGGEEPKPKKKIKKFRILQPIKNPKQLLTGKGLPNITFNIGGINIKKRGRL